jgi:hypothetical protein
MSTSTFASLQDGTMFWLNIVNIDAQYASDCTLFQVLEWGGMNVK